MLIGKVLPFLLFESVPQKYSTGSRSRQQRRFDIKPTLCYPLRGEIRKSQNGVAYCVNG